MKNERICPGIVNKSNRIKLDYFNANDAWSVSQHGTQITVTRTDAKNAVWLLDLRFHCCDRGIVTSCIDKLRIICLLDTKN